MYLRKSTQFWKYSKSTITAKNYLVTVTGVFVIRYFTPLQVTDWNLIMGHVWIFQLDNNPNKNNTKMGHWAQNQASAMAIPVLCPERQIIKIINNADYIFTAFFDHIYQGCQ